MMKTKIKWLIAVLVILTANGVTANQLNNTTNPAARGYNPSTQRLQQQMQTQQMQEQLKLQQDQQRQQLNLQRQAQEERNRTRQRIQNSQPGQQISVQPN